MTRKEKRKQLAIEKKLIIDDDYTVYNKVLEIYKYTFEEYLNYFLNFKELDKIIEESNLYFNPSQLNLKYHKNSNLKSKYLFCLNTFYIEKLKEEDIEVIKNTNEINNKTINIIKNTFNEIILKDNAKNITYGQPTPETIIPNGTIVLKFVVGKTNIKDDNLFMENRKKQQILIEKIINKLETELSKKIKTPVKIIFTKEM